MLSTEDDELWTAEEEIQLFLALHGLRPVGINKVSLSINGGMFDVD